MVQKLRSPSSSAVLALLLAPLCWGVSAALSKVAIGQITPLDLFAIGIAHTAATDGALLLATDSLFTAALAAALLGERLGPRLRVAPAAGVAGSVLAASLAAAGHGVLAKRVAPGRDTLSLTAVQMLVAAAIGLAVGAGAAAGLAATAPAREECPA